MNTLYVKFLGIPSITIEDKRVEFPFSKAECIFYLLLYEKEVSRETLSSLVWEKMDEASAKKNLRNAIYIIRKQIFDDIIISPKRSLLEINDKYKIISDIDFICNFDSFGLANNKNIEEYLQSFSGSFLEELKLKANTEFAEWIDTVNFKIRSQFINNLKIMLNRLIDDGEFYYSEMCCRKLIELEEYDETGYTNLMTIYYYQNKHQEAIDIYNNLVEKLNNDLSVKTSRETDEIYEKIIRNLKLKSEIKSVDFYGRDLERKKLYDNIYNFIGNKEFKSIIISGEDGIGKSVLINNIPKEIDLNLLFIKINCYEYETGFIFKFWDKVFQQISNLVKEKDLDIPNHLINTISRLFPTLNIDLKEELDSLYSFKNTNLVEKAIFDLFSLLSNKLKIIFIIDDLNNVDKASLELLYKTILANRFKIMMIATIRDETEKSDNKLYNVLKFNNIIEILRINRFNKEETNDFINIIMPEAVSYIDYIYSESEGNPLFIVEILNNLKGGNITKSISNRVETLIQGRLLSLSNESNKLLRICSLFQGMFFVEMLSKITDIKVIELIDLIDELLSKEILKEEIGIDGNLGLSFTHRKIREYVYNSISNSKRIILHSKIAEYYENELLNNKSVNRTLFPEMIYHFSSSNNKCKYFKYKIRWLEGILDYQHEIFPISGNSNSSGLIEYYLDESSLEKEFIDLKEIYEDLSCHTCKNCTEEEILYLYLFGRFNKNRGNAVDGLNLLNRAIVLSNESNKYEFAYYGYLQLVHFYVNINDTKSMGVSLEKAEELSMGLNDRCKIAVVWRLKGYYYILIGRYEEGQRFIDKALEIFYMPENKVKYILNIVAAQFYIGEKFRLQQSYDSALQYYMEAFELCNDNEECPAAAFILSKIGYIKYHQGIIDEAQFYYLKSLKAYDKSIFAWGRAEAYYHLYLIYKKKNMLIKAKQYIEEASIYANKYANDELKKCINSIIKSYN